MNPVMTAYCVGWEVVELGWVKPLTDELQRQQNEGILRLPRH